MRTLTGQTGNGRELLPKAAAADNWVFAPSELKKMVRGVGFEPVTVATWPLYFPFATRLPLRPHREILAFGMGDRLFIVAAAVGSARRD
ncbi:MAG: hypothetical protein ABSA97_05900 [Verrucomicrobiia bacterium]